MFESLESGAGLDLVIWLQENSNGLLDAIATLFHYMGSSVFYMAFTPVFYLSWNKVLGRRLLIGLLLAVLVGILAKEALQAPRPYQFAPDRVTAIVDESTGYGLPSGHVTNTVVILGLMGLWAKRRIAWIGAVIIAILMMWSRMILGVHYPQDVVGGLLLGMALVALIHYAETPLVTHWEKLSNPLRIGAILTIGAMMALVFWENEYGVTMSGAFTGALLGIGVERTHIRFSVDGSSVERALRYGLALVLLMAMYGSLKIAFDSFNPASLFRLIRYILIGFTALAIVPWLAIKLNLARPEVAIADTSIDIGG